MHPSLAPAAAGLLVMIACSSGSGSPVAPDGTQGANSSVGPVLEYVDPARRFTFAYSEPFGRTSEGTNNGFGDRVAAIRFSAFSAVGPGGEAVLTRGRPLIDVQAAGGLYDSIVREALPQSVLAAVDDLLPALSPTTLCEQLGREEHIDVNAPQLRALTSAQRDALRLADRMGNIRPRVLECAVDGDIVTFHKEAAAAEQGLVRQVFG